MPNSNGSAKIKSKFKRTALQRKKKEKKSTKEGRKKSNKRKHSHLQFKSIVFGEVGFLRLISLLR